MLPPTTRAGTARVLLTLLGAAIVCAIALVSVEGLAYAQSAGTAKESARQGASEYNLGHFADAAALFEKAYRVDPAPVLLFNIAQCHRRLGDNDRALFFYRRYLQEAPADVPDRKEVETRVAELERSIREQSELKTRPPPGIQREASAAGERPAQAQPSTATALTMPTLSPPPAVVAPAISVPATPPASDEGSRRTMRRLGWIAGGAAAAAVIFGGVEAKLWSSRTRRFNDHVGPSPDDPTRLSRNCGADEPNYGGPGCASLHDDASSARTFTIVGFTAGALLAAGSVTLFLLSTPASDRSGPNVASVCAPNLLSAGVSCRVSF